MHAQCGNIKIMLLWESARSWCILILFSNQFGLNFEVNSIEDGPTINSWINVTNVQKGNTEMLQTVWQRLLTKTFKVAHQKRTHITETNNFQKGWTLKSWALACMQCVFTKVTRSLCELQKRRKNMKITKSIQNQRSKKGSTNNAKWSQRLSNARMNPCKKQ